MVWRTSLDGALLQGQEQWCAFTGQTPEELRNEGWIRALHPDDREASTNAWRHAIATRSRYEMDERVRRFDGEYRILRVRTMPLLDRAGEVREWVRVCSDITETRNAERGVQSGEKQLRRVLNSLFAFVTVCTPDGVLVEVNTPPLRAAGIQPLDVKGKRLWETYWWSYSPTVQLLLRQAIERAAAGEPSRYDVQVRIAGGSLRWIDSMITPLYDEEGAITHLITSAVDVSDRKRVEQALQSSEAEMRAVFESASVGIAQLDAATSRVLRFNETFCTMTGHSRERLSRMTIEDLCHRDAQAGSLADLSPVRLGKQDRLVAELTFHHHRGQERFVEMFASLQRDARNEPDQITVVLLDMTDRKLAEMQLQRSRSELQELNATLEARVRDRTAVAQRRAEQLRALTLELTEAESRERRRLAQLLHDQFQQLVSAAKLKAGVVRGRIGDNDALTTMMLQIEDLLDQAIGASRSLVTELSPPLLHDAGLAPALHWLARRMERDYGLTVHIDAEEGAQVEGEQVRTILFECARELLFNITKHANTSEAWVRLHHEANLLTLAVEDRGRGFEPEKVWSDPQTRASFGLFSLRERLTLIGGVATIHSAPGEGTTVEIVLPVATSEPGDADRPWHSPSSKPTIESSRLPRTRVLVADDHRLFREGLIALISQEAYVELVGEASDGNQAIALAQELQPDVIIVDVSMPGANGIQVTHAVTRSLPRTRVIGLSMHEREDMAAAMREAGACAYCSKSGPGETLLSALRHAAGLESAVPAE